MTGAQTLPPGFINNGTVLDSSLVRTTSATRTGTTLIVTIQSYTGHSYQLERTDALGGAWTAISTAQPGAGGVLTFTDSGGATGARRFYRVTVAP